MSLKTKLTSLITTFILLCSLLTVGVFAVKNTTFNVGGDIVFNVQGIEATITRGATAGFTADKTIGNEAGNILSDIELNNDMTADQVAAEFAPWSGLNLAFSENVATIKLTITNTADEGADNYLDITALADATTKNNAKVSVVNDAGGITALLEPQQSASFTITFSVIDDEYSASLEGFSVNFDLQKKVLADFPVLSADMTYGTLKFRTISGQSGLSVEDVGAEDMENYQSTGDLIIPAYVNLNDTVYVVTSIGDWAFFECGLTSLVIPNSVTSIGYSVFYGCTNLKNVTFGNGVTNIDGEAFSGCTSLTSLVIPNSVTSIGYMTFDGCSGLTSITIPNSVTSIGDFAFSYCSGLTSITIPDSVTSIGDSAFSNCTSLTSIVVENGNSVYDSRNNCNAIIETATNTLITGCKNTIITNTVEVIGEYAFSNCMGLTSITISDSVKSIENYAFSGCTSLTSVTIGKGVTSIVTGSEVFSGCESLTSIVVESGNSVYDSRNNCNAIIETATNTLIQSCQNTIIPNTLEKIYDCTGLTNVIIPEGVKELGSGAFADSVTSITIPVSVTSITEIDLSIHKNLKTVNYAGTQEQWLAIEGVDYIEEMGLPSGCTMNYLG